MDEQVILEVLPDRLSVRIILNNAVRQQDLGDNEVLLDRADVDEINILRNGAEELDIEDLLGVFTDFLFQYSNGNFYDYQTFLERTFVIPVVQIIETGITAADIVNREVSLLDLTAEKIESIIANMQQSGDPEDIITLRDIKIILLLRREDWWHIIGGASNVILDNMKPLTAITQKLNNEPINCMAFALAYHIIQPHNPRRDLQRILVKAKEIQDLCKFGTYVCADQLKDFVRMYPEYRVTIICHGINDHSRLNYKGVY